MEFTTWIQLDVQEQIQYLNTAHIDEILMFIRDLCTTNIKNCKTTKIYIERNRMLQRKLNSIPDLEHVKDEAMKEMCKLCKAEMEDK